MTPALFDEAPAISNLGHGWLAPLCAARCASVAGYVPQSSRTYRGAPPCAGYSFENPVRSFVIVKPPSARTDILILWPWSISLRLARNCSGELCSAPPAAERCSCQKSSSPGASWTVCQYSGEPPFLSPLFITATRARIASTNCGAPECGSPWRVV